MRADATPAVFGVSGYTGGGKELIAVHEQTPDVEPFGLYGVELTHKHVPEMKKYSGLKHTPLFVPSVGHYAQGMLVDGADHARHRRQEGERGRRAEGAGRLLCRRDVRDRCGRSPTASGWSATASCAPTG